MISVFLFKNRKFLTFILLITISFTMMGISTNDFTLNISAIFLTVLYPFEYVINGTIGFFKSTLDSIGKLEVIRKELDATRKRLQKYEASSGDFQKLRMENSRLRSLLNKKKLINYENISASVISKDPQRLYQSLIIDKGSSDGIKKDMPVVSYRSGRIGVVGRIVSVTANAAKVSTIRESKFYIGSLMEKSRYYGLVKGHGFSKSCDLKYVDINAPVALGDVVITSGHSDIFPKGLTIGKVIYINRENGRFFLQAKVLPVINFASLEDVYVIKKRPSKELKLLRKGAQ